MSNWLKVFFQDLWPLLLVCSILLILIVIINVYTYRAINRQLREERLRSDLLGDENSQESLNGSSLIPQFRLTEALVLPNKPLL